MVIQELKPSKKVAGRWLAVLEDGSILRVGENEVLVFDLYTGKELSETEAEEIMASARRNDLKLKAINWVAKSPHSRRQLEQKLSRDWEAAEEETAAICDRMEELGYLNDAAYAAMVVRHYSARGFGERKIRDELYRRGISRELWDEALNEAQDPADTIDAFVAKKLAGKTPDRKELQKVSAALARRGYSWSDISEALGRYEMECEDDY